MAHDLDAEIQEELYGHMQDKLIAYLDGEEALAEADAFILVREHFGNPSAVKGLLQDVHAYEADVTRNETMMLKTVAAILVFIGLAAFVPTIHGAISLFCVVHLVPPYGEAAVTSPYALVIVKTLILLAQLLVVAGGARFLVLSTHKTDTEQLGEAHND